LQAAQKLAIACVSVATLALAEPRSHLVLVRTRFQQRTGPATILATALIRQVWQMALK
jgi:hypothetical protein